MRGFQGDVPPSGLDHRKRVWVPVLPNPPSSTTEGHWHGGRGSRQDGVPTMSEASHVARPLGATIFWKTGTQQMVWWHANRYCRSEPKPLQQVGSMSATCFPSSQEGRTAAIRAVWPTDSSQLLRWKVGLSQYRGDRSTSRGASGAIWHGISGLVHIFRHR